MVLMKNIINKLKDKETLLNDLNSGILEEDFKVTDDFINTLKEAIEYIDPDTLDMKSATEPEKVRDIEQRFFRSLSNPSNLEFVKSAIAGDDRGQKIPESIRALTQAVYYNSSLMPTQGFISTFVSSLPEQISRKLEGIGNIYFVGGTAGSGKTAMTSQLYDSIKSMFMRIANDMAAGKAKEELINNVKNTVQALSPLMEDFFGKPINEVLDIDSFSQNFVDNTIKYFDKYKNQLNLEDDPTLDTKMRDIAFQSVPEKDKTGTVRIKQAVTQFPFAKVDDSEHVNLPEAVAKHISDIGDIRSPMISFVTTYNPTGAGFQHIIEIFDGQSESTKKGAPSEGVISRRGVNLLVKKDYSTKIRDLIKTNILSKFNDDYYKLKTINDMFKYHYLNEIGEKEEAQKLVNGWKSSIDTIEKETLKNELNKSLSNLISQTKEIYQKIGKENIANLINKLDDITSNFSAYFNQISSKSKGDIVSTFFGKLSSNIDGLISDLDKFINGRNHQVALNNIGIYKKASADEMFGIDDILNLSKSETPTLDLENNIIKESNEIETYKKKLMENLKNIISEINKNPELVKKYQKQIPLENKNFEELLRTIEIKDSGYELKNIHDAIDNYHRINHYGICKLMESGAIKLSEDVPRNLHQVLNDVIAMKKYFKNEDDFKYASMRYLTSIFGIDSPVTKAFFETFDIVKGYKLHDIFSFFDEFSKIKIDYRVNENGEIDITDNGIKTLKEFLSKNIIDFSETELSTFNEQFLTKTISNVLEQLYLGKQEIDTSLIDNFNILFNENLSPETINKIEEELGNMESFNVLNNLRDAFEDEISRYENLNINELKFYNEEDTGELPQESDLRKKWEDLCKKVSSMEGDKNINLAKIQEPLSKQISTDIKSNDPVRQMRANILLSGMLKLAKIKDKNLAIS